eukprot:318445-Prymnesium_polylepis.2
MLSTSAAPTLNTNSASGVRCETRYGCLLTRHRPQVRRVTHTHVTVSTRQTDLLLRSEGVHYHRNTAPRYSDAAPMNRPRRYRADRYRADTAPQK